MNPNFDPEKKIVFIGTLSVYMMASWNGRIFTHFAEEIHITNPLEIRMINFMAALALSSPLPLKILIH